MIKLLLANLNILLIFILLELLSRNLNTLLRSNYYDKTIIVKFKYFIRSNYYNKTIIEKFKCFIKIKLL
jgi:hypothetical protein